MKKPYVRTKIMSKGILFEVETAEKLRNLLKQSTVEICGGYSDGNDIKVRGKERVNIECKLNERAVGGQVALDISPNSGKIRGVSKRSRSSQALQQFISTFLIENDFIGRERVEILNKSFNVEQNPTKLHYEERMSSSPGKNIIIIGKNAYLLEEYSPEFRKLRFRKKGNGITAVVENGRNKTKGETLEKLVRRLF